MDQRESHDEAVWVSQYVADFRAGEVVIIKGQHECVSACNFDPLSRGIGVEN